MIQKIERWRARDGQEYETAEAAEAADAVAELVGTIRSTFLAANQDFVNSGGDLGTAEILTSRVVAAAVVRPREIAVAFSGYAKRRGLALDGVDESRASFGAVQALSDEALAGWLHKIACVGNWRRLARVRSALQQIVEQEKRRESASTSAGAAPGLVVRAG